MRCQYQFRPYRRSFRQPVITSHGLWKAREGIIVRLTNEAGQVGWGEIAPIPWFGSETIEQALEFCRLSPHLTCDIATIPDQLPSCQFAFESAWESIPTNTMAATRRTNISVQPAITSVTNYCVLLPTGKAALQSWEPFWRQGHRTFKLKIGSRDFHDEFDLCMALRSTLVSTCSLRLDANGALSVQQAKILLEACDHIDIEFVEQPLPPNQFNAMQQLAEQYETSIALDESVATLQQLQDCYKKGWRGVFVIKPAIMGSPSRLRQFCQANPIDAVFSSAFETTVGRRAGLQLAAELGNLDRALGYGTAHWFDEVEIDEFEQLWQTL